MADCYIITSYQSKKLLLHGDAIHKIDNYVSESLIQYKDKCSRFPVGFLP